MDGASGAGPAAGGPSKKRWELQMWKRFYAAVIAILLRGVRPVQLLAAMAFLITPGLVSAAEIVTFAGFSHGQIVDTDFAAQGIISITADNFRVGGPDLAVVFNSANGSSSDPDLVAPWSGGNLPSTTPLGNILIIQENSTGCGDDICDDPDDEGTRLAGEFDILFSTAVDLFGFDLIDVESTLDPSIGEQGSIHFYDGATVGILDWTDLLTRDGTISFGDNTANRVLPLTPSEVSALTGQTLTQFDRVVIQMGGSGGVDNITFTPIPEPSSFVLMGIGLASLALRGSRRPGARRT